MRDFTALADRYKLKMVDLEPGISPGSPSSWYDVVELKYDGFFVMTRIKAGYCQIITSGGDVREEFPVKDIPDAILIGEWIFGTNWSKLPAQQSIQNKIIVHNMVEYRGHEVTDIPYRDVKTAVKEYCPLLGERFVPINSFRYAEWEELWEKYVEDAGFEGLIFKNSQASYFQQKPGRMKNPFTMDYVVMGYKEGLGRLEGTLGSIEGGLYINGKLTKVCTVGGGFTDDLRAFIWSHREEFLGKVMIATGKALFSSGALRHPAFKPFSDDNIFRDDKRPDQCVWENA